MRRILIIDDDLDMCQLLSQFLQRKGFETETAHTCLLYTSDAADERSSVDLGGRRIIKKKKIAVVAATRST